MLCFLISDRMEDIIFDGFEGKSRESCAHQINKKCHQPLMQNAKMQNANIMLSIPEPNLRHPSASSPNKSTVMENLVQAMEYVDHVAARVSFSALTGLGLGTMYATFRGLPLRSTALKVGGSFAMVGTVVFGIERLAYAAMKDQLKQEKRLLLTSHAFSGVAGGALNGYLFHRKPRQGMVYFVPVMMGVAGIEMYIEQKREERIKQLMLENHLDSKEEAGSQ